MMLEPAVEGAPAEAQRLRGLTHVPAVALERLADEYALHLLQRQVLEPCGRPAPTQPQVGGADQRTVGHEHRALQGVVQLAHVAGPSVALEGLQRLGLEAGERLAVPRGIAPEE